MRTLCRIALCLIILHGLGASSSTHAGEAVLRVGLYINPPFVMQEADQFTGMAVELWERVAEALRRESAYTVYPSLAELVAAGGKGEVDILVTNLAVTVERAQSVKFTFPWFDSGLRIIGGRPRTRTV